MVECFMGGIIPGAGVPAQWETRQDSRFELLEIALRAGDGDGARRQVEAGSEQIDGFVTGFRTALERLGRRAQVDRRTRTLLDRGTMATGTRVA